MSNINGTAIWEAHAEEYPCICVGGSNDGGYNLSIYQDEEGAVIGGIIYGEMCVFVDAFGHVPAKVLLECLR